MQYDVWVQQRDKNLELPAVLLSYENDGTARVLWDHDVNRDNVVRVRRDDIVHALEYQPPKKAQKKATKSKHQKKPKRSTGKKSLVPSLWELNGIDKESAIGGIRKALPERLKGCAESAGHFFLYCYERQRMWQRRNEGQSPPFSKNKILGEMSFCNNYRELDRGTCYFRSQMLHLWEVSQPVESQRIWIEKVLWASGCYRIVNKIETFATLGGIPTKGDWKGFRKKLKKLPPPIFTSAHLNPGLSRYLQTMDFLGGHVSSVATQLFHYSRERNLEGCFQALLSIPNVGKFFAWQITCDLLECQCLEPCTDNDWTELGPGAIKGIEIIFEKCRNSQMGNIDLVRTLEQSQDKIYEAMKLVFPKVDGKHLSLKVIEHALCEFSKFCTMSKRSNVTGGYRHRKSRSHLDDHKKCQSCRIEEEVVFFCDFCLEAHCKNCQEQGNESWWKCPNCVAFESITWANTSKGV